MAPPSARIKIVDAALTLVRLNGASRLTLDEAAKAAGLSKGGVLYHFKTKDDLIRAMLQRLIDQCDELHLHHYENEAPGPYRWARTVVKTAFDPCGPVNDPINSALLAVIASDLNLITPLKEAYAKWNERLLSDSPDPWRATLICMAMDGYLFERILNLIPADDPSLDQIRQRALDLLKDDQGGSQS